MDKTQEPPKKCFCARCFLPVEPEDRVDIEGQSFHRCCSTCCVCHTIPTSLKMFYGHVFCADCFKSHVLSRFRGESPRIHSNSWWMQWAPGGHPQEANINESKETKPETPETPKEPPKKCICARCLQSVDDNSKVIIGGQSFHPQCAKCYFCHCIPKENVKIYYGQVFCEECFHKHILNRNKDNPSEFFKGCLDQWQNNPQFAENMKEFLAGNKESSPFIVMMSGQQPPFCRFGNGPQQEWCQNNEPKKSATPAVSTGNDSLELWDTPDDRTEVSGSEIPSESNPINESANVENLNCVSAAEKIEKLTKYLNDKGQRRPQKRLKKWKNFNGNAKLSSDLHELHENLHEELHENLHEELHENLHEELHEELHVLHEVSHEVSHEEFHEVSHEEFHEVSHEESHEELHEESHEELHEESHEELHEEPHEGLHEELQEELHEKPHDELHEELQEELQKELQEESNEELLAESHAESAYCGWVNLQISKTFSKTQLNCPKCLWQCGPIYVNSGYL